MVCVFEVKILLLWRRSFSDGSKLEGKAVVREEAQKTRERMTNFFLLPEGDISDADYQIDYAMPKPSVLIHSSLASYHVLVSQIYNGGYLNFIFQFSTFNITTCSGLS